MESDSLFIAIAAITAAVVAILGLLWRRRELVREESPVPDQLQSQLQTGTALAELAGRLDQMSRSQAEVMAQMSERLQAQERQISTTLEQRLADLGKRLGDGLNDHAEKTGTTIKQVHERLAVIDAAQRNLVELSSQVVGLQDILSNKQARGAFGEIQLNDLVSSILPPSAYGFQVTLSSGVRADCLLQLPNPPGAIAIDAKFPLESYQNLVDAADETQRVQAARQFSRDVGTHVAAIANKYIVPGETADSALMFLPSEAIYAELHARFRNVVEDSFRKRVWIVSPTTLMATLNTVRAVLKDAHMREQAHVIQREVHSLLDDMSRLDDRVGKLDRHFSQAQEDLRQIRISTDKVIKRSERIQDLELGAETTPDADQLAPPLPD